jgi:hypothetical protein
MTSAERKQLRRTIERAGVHATAMKRHLTWVEDFARVGEVDSAIDALGDARALAQELEHPLESAGIDCL